MKILKGISISIVALLILSCNSGDKNFDATGVFESTEILVSSEASGKLLSLKVDDGDMVEKGQVIGYIDSTQLYLQKIQLLVSSKGVKVQTPDIKKQLAAFDEQISAIERERERVLNLIKADAASSKQLDDITAELEVLKKRRVAQMSMLEKSVSNIDAQSSAIEIQVAQLNDMLSKCRIEAPISGVVLSTYIHSGELAAIGYPILKLADIDNMTLRAYVTYDQLSSIRLGDEVEVSSGFEKLGNRIYKGKIVWISEKSEFTPKTAQTEDERANLVYAIKIAVKNDGYLKIGMYGETRFNK